jgi:hypothetical protein
MVLIVLKKRGGILKNDYCLFNNVAVTLQRTIIKAINEISIRISCYGNDGDKRLGTAHSAWRCG